MYPQNVSQVMLYFIQLSKLVRMAHVAAEEETVGTRAPVSV